MSYRASFSQLDPAVDKWLDYLSVIYILNIDRIKPNLFSLHRDLDQVQAEYVDLFLTNTANLFIYIKFYSCLKILMTQAA